MFPHKKKRLRKDQNNLKTSWSYNLVPSLPLKKKILSILAKDHFKIEIELFPWCFFEFAKSRGLRGNVGYAGAWSAWARGYMGQFMTRVAWVAWVKIFFTWVNILCGS